MTNDPEQEVTTDKLRELDINLQAALHVEMEEELEVQLGAQARADTD